MALLSGLRSVRTVKHCDQGFESAAEAVGWGQHV